MLHVVDFNNLANLNISLSVLRVRDTSGTGLQNSGLSCQIRTVPPDSGLSRQIRTVPPDSDCPARFGTVPPDSGWLAAVHF